MPVKVRTRGKVSIVEIEGDCTFGSGALGRPLDLKGEAVDDVGASLQSLLDEKRAQILLDMSATSFIDSAGLGEMIAFKKRALGLGGDVKLLRPAARVLKLIETVRLDQVFEIYDEEETGIASF